MCGARSRTGVGHADDPALRLADLGEVRHEALPHARDHELRAGRREPAVERGNDVRVGVRRDDVRQLLRREMARHAQKELVERQVAAGVDDGAGAVVDDEELVRLHGVAVAADQVGEHQAHMLRVAVELDGHGGLRKGSESGNVDCRKPLPRPA